MPGISAEAELLAAIVLFLERVGLSSKDIVIKVSSRKVLQAILERYNVPEESVGPVSVVVDKMEKIPLEKVSLATLQMLQAPLVHKFECCICYTTQVHNQDTRKVIQCSMLWAKGGVIQVCHSICSLWRSCKHAM